MAFIPLKFSPGVNKDVTAYAGKGGWTETEKVRFRSGTPQKIGGWTKYIPATLVGTCRQLWTYITTFGDNLLAIGTNEKVYLEVSTTLYDITPLRTTLTTTQTDNSMTTASGSTTVTFDLASGVHGAVTGDYVTISGVTGDIGGVPDAEVNANHQITQIDTDSFTIVVTTAASSTVAGGGGTAISMAFEVAVGNASPTWGYGWGTDTYGRLTWGSGSVTPVTNEQQDWWFDHIDNDLILSERNGAVYYWVRGTATNPTSVLGTRAVTLASIATGLGYDANAVPVKVMQTLVSQNDQHLIAFGAVPYGSVATADFDPLLIRWANQDDPSQWTPKVTNSAGSIRLSRGSEIIAALSTRQEILVWTNSNLYSMQFLGTTDVFGVHSYTDTISIMGPRAVTTANDIVYWMGKDKFYVYDGRTQTLPCTLRAHVFGDINLNEGQGVQVVSGTNEEWSEIWWFYPSATASWNDRYVVYNYAERIWYHGNIVRTAWLDSSLRDKPLGVNSNETTTDGVLYNHEDGLDDAGSAMTAYIKSNDFDLSEGDKLMLSRRILPDVDFTGSTAGTPTLTMQVQSRQFPGDALAADSSDTQTVTNSAVGVYTKQVFIRARGRQMAITIQSTDAGVQWRGGVSRIDVRPDGRQ